MEVKIPKLSFFGSLRIEEILKRETDVKRVLERVAVSISEIEEYTMDLTKDLPEYILFGDGTFAFSMVDEKTYDLQDMPEVFEEKRDIGVDSFEYARDVFEELKDYINLNQTLSKFNISGFYKTRAKPFKVRDVLKNYISPKPYKDLPLQRMDMYQITKENPSGEIIASGKKGVLMYNVGGSRMYPEARLLNHLLRLQTEYHPNIWKSLPSSLNIWTSPLRHLIVSNMRKTIITKPRIKEGGIPITPNDIDEVARIVREKYPHAEIVKEQQHLDDFNKFYLTLTWNCKESHALIELHPVSYLKAKLKIKGRSRNEAYKILLTYLKAKGISIKNLS